MKRNRHVSVAAARESNNRGIRNQRLVINVSGVHSWKKLFSPLLGQVVTDTSVTEHQKSQQRVNAWLAIHVLEIAQKQITAMLINNEHSQMKIKDALPKESFT
uniref:Uncharacterized protein n=1 Tax=Salix viminalis TaxID=40686 RepID=A0A6N2N7G5_SALVM